jgi:hypothetical protein
MFRDRKVPVPDICSGRGPTPFRKVTGDGWKKVTCREMYRSGEITDFYAKLERIDRESGGFRQESNSRWNVLSLM